MFPLPGSAGGLGVSRRSYYRPKTRQPDVDEGKTEKVKAIIEHFPTYGYLHIAFLLGWNRKVVQRICRLKGWQVRKRSKDHRPG
jgi:putative transposase